MTGHGAEQLLHERQRFQDAVREVSAAQGVAFGAAGWQLIEGAFSAMHEELRHKAAALPAGGRHFLSGQVPGYAR